MSNLRLYRREVVFGTDNERKSVGLRWIKVRTPVHCALARLVRCIVVILAEAVNVESQRAAVDSLYHVGSQRERELQRKIQHVDASRWQIRDARRRVHGW